MGTSVDENALAICVRETLYSHLASHPGLEQAEVEVLALDGRTLIDVEGFGFTLTLDPGPGFDDANDPADAAKLVTDCAPELLTAIKRMIEALAMCTPNTRHGEGVVHNARSLAMAVVAKAEGTGR